MSLPRLSWNMADDGVVTIFATDAEGRLFDLCDVWRRPAIERGGMGKDAARDFQVAAAERICAAWNKDAIEHTWHPIGTCPENTTVAFKGGAADWYSVGRMRRSVGRMSGTVWPSWWGGGWANNITSDEATWPTHWRTIA